MFRQSFRKLSTASNAGKRQSNGLGAPILLGFGLGAAAGMLMPPLDNQKTNGKLVVHTDEAPAAVGPYSQAIRDGKGTVYCSGQIGLVPGTKNLVSDDVREQSIQAFTNLAKVLEASNSSLGQVCKTTVLLSDIKDYAIVNEEYNKFFGGDKPPARAAFAAKDLPLGAKIEIDAIAIEN